MKEPERYIASKIGFGILSLVRIRLKWIKKNTVKIEVDES